MEVSRKEIEGQLSRMAISPVFARAGRIYELLAYLVRHAVNGGGGTLDQRSIAIDVFGRGEDFDPAYDAIVRAEIGRLRNKLAEYYGADGRDDALRLEVPRGSYLPVIARKDAGHRNAAPRQDIRYCHADDGVSIAYSVMGSGYPLVIVPNWLNNLDYDVRNPLTRHYWEELPKHFTVIRYDNRGFGLSQRDVGELTLDRLARDLENLVTTLGLDRFALFGFSGGSPVATYYAAGHPGKVSHLTILGGFIRGSAHWEGGEDIKALTSLIRVGWGIEHSAFRQIFASFLIPDGTREQYRLIDKAMRASADAAMAEKYSVLMSNFDITEEARRVACPTLVIHKQHGLLPLVVAQHAATNIPRSRLVLLDTANHAIQPDEPAWASFIDELTSFCELRKLAPVGPRT